VANISQPERAKAMKTKIRYRGLPFSSDETGKYISSWKLIPSEREMLW
jgi:hypothetical protein